MTDIELTTVTSRTPCKRANKILVSCFYLLIMVVGLSFVSNLYAATTPKWLMQHEDGCNSGQIKDCMSAATAYSLGKLLKNKVKVDKNKGDYYKQKTQQMGEQGCEQNSNLGNCYQLGLMYFEGRAVNRDIPKGMKLIVKSCKGGHQPACNWLDDTGVY